MAFKEQRQVGCFISYIVLEGDYTEIDSVRATCSRCEHVTESYGTSSKSINRCLVLMRKECPLRANNFYVVH